MIFRKIHKTILIGIILVFTVTSCSLPPALSVINNLKTGIDGLLMIQGEKTTNDRALSSVTEKDCRMDRILNNKDICKDEKSLPSKTRAQMLEELRHSLDQQEGVSWEYHHNP
tara:strand:- start:374 stop:712 length:339 start_codon:yes stop_codon:yes gene_type:complete